MNKTKIYFDNAATTPLHPKVFEKMLPYLKEEYGNPSSIHSFGRKVRVAIEEARETVADFINANPSEIYFVSSGTEANNFPVFGIAKTEFSESGRKKIITSKAEHPSVLEAFSELGKTGFDPGFIDCNNNSTVDMNKLTKAISSDVSFVSIIHINNETGAVNDIRTIAEDCRARNVYFHTDAVQSFGKIDIDVNKTGIHSLSASGHKINGPKGTGIVYAKSGTPLSPMMFGGSQERNRRGGTENSAGIVGFAEAVKIARLEMKANNEIVSAIKSKMIEGITNIDKTGIEINNTPDSSPYVLSVTFKSECYKNDAEAYLMYLDINGIAASNGAACTSGTLKPSHVILSMGKSEHDASGTIRFSFGARNTLDEVDYTLDVLKKMSDKFRR